MTYLNVDALQESVKLRGSEWIKIGVDTGAGMTAWPQIITYVSLSSLPCISSLSATMTMITRPVGSLCDTRL